MNRNILLVVFWILSVGCEDSGGSSDIVEFEEPDYVESDSPFIPQKTDYLIISADVLAQTANLFAAYRESAGYKTSVLTMKDITGGAEGLSDEDRSEAIYARVKEAYENRDKSRPFYLLIIGDAEYFDNGEDFLVPAPKSSIGWEPGYSDNFYADMNGDHVPDIAVGRIPVRNDKDGAAVLDKIKQHENSYEPGLWNRRLNVYAGEGDFGPEIDAAIELAVQKGFEEVSYDFDIRFAYDNPASDYYYAPFQEITLKLLTEGAVMVVYIGHGGGETEVSSLTLLKSQHRFPMAVFFACGTGDFLMLDDSDPEILMKQTGAPFEFLVSETTSHPYGNAIFAREL